MHAHEGQLKQKRWKCKKANKLRNPETRLPKIDLSISNINNIDRYENNLTCTFTRDNNNTSIQNYFVYEPGTKYYMVAAYGQIITDRNKITIF